MNIVTLTIASFIMASMFAFNTRSFKRVPPPAPPVLATTDAREIPPPAPPTDRITTDDTVNSLSSR